MKQIKVKENQRVIINDRNGEVEHLKYDQIFMREVGTSFIFGEKEKTPDIVATIISRPNYYTSIVSITESADYENPTVKFYKFVLDDVNDIRLD